MTFQVASICIFGSMARGDSDDFSDRDVLVVSDSVEWREMYAADLRLKGWSVSEYFPKVLMDMSKDGSLFLQHVCQEGEIVFDKNYWLQDLISNFSPKPFYAEIENAIELAKPLDRIVYRNEGYFAALDVVFSFLRNFGIIHAANSGKYIFSFSDISEWIVLNFDLDSDHVNLLFRLREYKKAYRARIFHSNLNFKEDYYLSLQLLKKLDLNVDVLEISHPIRSLSNNYATMRDIELKMVNHYDINILDNGCVPDLLARSWQGIVHPSSGYPKQYNLLNDEKVRRIDQMIGKLQLN